MKTLPDGKKFPYGLKRTLPTEALNCQKRTVTTQLKSVVLFTFTLFGQIIWDVGFINDWLKNQQTSEMGVTKTLEIHKEYPVRSLIVKCFAINRSNSAINKKIVSLQQYYKSKSRNWPAKGEEAFLALSAAADRGNLDGMLKACKIIIDAPKFCFDFT